MRRKVIFPIAVVLLSVIASTVAATAQPSEFDLISKHIQKQYQAKKVGIPLLWLAKAAVHMAKPAGVKSFGVSLFKDLSFSVDTLDTEMQRAMRSSFGPEWSSVFHVRSRDGQQAYMYMKDTGKEVKLAVVTIEKDQAAVIRATINPERLASFINDPSIFGISLSDHADPDPSNPTGH